MSQLVEEKTENHRRPVIMVVDDEELVTQSLSSFFEFETDYRVENYHSPSEALKRLKTAPVDLVISDFLMPEMNGLTFLAEVKKMYPDVPRIILTGYADKENAIKGINEVGLFQYIEKPWDNNHLKLIIENALANKNLKDLLNVKIKELDKALLQKDSLTRQNTVLQQELILAQQVQESLLPQSLPDNKKISISAKFLPAFEVGGDIYDVIYRTDDVYCVLIADVTGHGIQAALSTVLLKHSFAICVDNQTTPRKMLGRMNEILNQSLPEGVFVAALIATIDKNTGRVVIANAGIPHPILIKRSKKQFERITANGLLLGIVDVDNYESGKEVVFDLQDKDLLFIYTDGLNEAENAKGEQFDEYMMARIFEQQMEMNSDGFLDRIISAAKAFCYPGYKFDDITALAVEYRK